MWKLRNLSHFQNLNARLVEMSKQNEEDSAVLALQRLKDSKLGNQELSLINKLILSSKEHEIRAKEAELDNALFLDFDLYILGQFCLGQARLGIFG